MSLEVRDVSQFFQRSPMSYKSVSRNMEVHTTLSADRIARGEELKVPLKHHKFFVA